MYNRMELMENEILRKKYGNNRFLILSRVIEIVLGSKRTDEKARFIFIYN